MVRAVRDKRQAEEEMLTNFICSIEMHKRGHRRARGEHSHNIPMPHMPLAGKLVPFTEEVCWHIKQEPSKYTH